MPKLSLSQYRLCANTLRMLAVDAVEKAASGHPGMPLGAADMAFVLWHDFLKFDPTDPHWPNRDRFILSAGHGSMLLYGLLHLFGYDLSLDDLKNFRQWGSRTPGHPEHGLTPGVEATTGPLGQGFAMGVGMALSAKMAAAKFNPPEQPLVDHYVYAIVSDGDLMEGITHEAASLAGHLRLDNLIYLYDDNGITIDGAASLSFSDDTAKRFQAYGWYVQTIDGHDYLQIHRALRKAQRSGRPNLIIAKTHIGYGSPTKQDRSSCHGSPLGAEEVAGLRRNLDWPEDSFHVPEEVYALCRQKVKAGRRAHNKWQKSFDAWSTFNQERAELWNVLINKKLPQGFWKDLYDSLSREPAATRTLSGNIIQKIAEAAPWFVCGSADLAGSTNCQIKNSGFITASDFSGQNIHFGIREHALAAIMNGISLHGFFQPAGSTFLVFSDYCRPAIRLAALMKQPVIFVFTHDSIFVGEDGPTHQPVEHLSSLRLIPNLQVIRPADAQETAAAWQLALQKRDGPTALILTRQKLTAIERQSAFALEDMSRGGYIIRTFGDKPQVVIFASGSEVPLSLEAAALLSQENVICQVVSVPCLEAFLSQPADYRNAISRLLPTRVAIEAGRGGLWHQILGGRGLVISVDDFGFSAPDRVLAEKLGLIAPRVAERIKHYLMDTAYWT